MKIGIVTSSYPQSSQDDAGNFVHRVALEVKSRGHEIKVIAPYTGGEKSYILDGIRVKRFDYFYPRRTQRLCGRAGMSVNIRNGLLVKLQLLTYTLALVTKTLRELSDVELIHVHWPLPNAVGAIIANKIRGVPFVNTIHGAEAYMARRYHFGWALRATVAQSSVSTVNSRATLQACLDVGCRRENMVLVPGGVDMEFYQPRGHSWTGDGCHIVSVGSLIERKGLEYLIEAVAQLIAGKNNLTLTIAGKGPRKSALLDLIRNTGIEKRTKIVEHASDEDLLNLYYSADVFVLPSIIDSFGDTEGLGAVLLEAMACRVPVVGTNVGGIPDIIKDGHNGLLVPQKDSSALAAAIRRLLANREEKERLAQNGYETVLSSFSWKNIGKQYVRLFEEIVSKS